MVAFLERTISLASILHSDVWPRLAASLMDLFTFCSSRCMSVARGALVMSVKLYLQQDPGLGSGILRICLSTLRCSPRIDCFHFFICSFGSLSPDHANIARASTALPDGRKGERQAALA